MDGFNEKKWFVYVVDHHEGPFSPAEIQQMIMAGSANAGTYLWAEGMPDWRQILEIPVFDSMLRGTSAAIAPPPPAAGGELALDMSPSLSNIAAAAGAESLPSPLEIAAQSAQASGGPTPSLALDNDKTKPTSQKADFSEGLPPVPLETSATSGGKTKKTGLSNLLLRGNELIQHAMKNTGKETSKSFGAGEVQLQADHLSKHHRPFNAAVSDGGMVRGTPISQVNKVGKKSGLGKLVVPIALVGLAGYAYSEGYFDSFLKSGAGAATSDFANDLVAKVVDLAPVLGSWLTPFPKPEGVSDDEYEELKAAARARESSEGSKAALAVSAQTSGTPLFFVSSNVAGSVPFKIKVEGISETLLNQLSFSQELEVKVFKHLGKSLAVALPGGQPIPRGMYKVTFSTGVLAPMTKTYFLGGPQDAQYTQRLKEYHDRLRAKAQGELMELQQFAATLDSRFSLTTMRFNALRKGKKGPMQLKLWQEFEVSWVKMGNQLDSTFKKWTPEAIRNDYFYGKLYELTADAGTALDRLHRLQQNYFKADLNSRTFEIQLGEASSNVQNALSVLKTKLDDAVKTPPLPNGMPKREEL